MAHSIFLAEQVDRARKLAAVAHHGQRDKAGDAYLGHCQRVVANYIARMRGAGEAVRPEFYAGWIAAWLHDTVEDTPITLDLLEALDFPDRAIEVVGLLTYDSTRWTRNEYYARIAVDPLAVTVKAADMDDNSDPARLVRLEKATAVRLREKYRKGYEALGLRPQHHLSLVEGV